SLYTLSLHDALPISCKSSQPQRRGRPVTAPNSFPRSRTSLASRSGISVGNGPPPTLVVYAFEIPSTCLIFVGGTPTPVAAPPDVALEDVTYGYVPWSMSNMVPCAPSNNTDFPASSARFNSSAVSQMYARIFSPSFKVSSTSCEKSMSAP